MKEMDIDTKELKRLETGLRKFYPIEGRIPTDLKKLVGEFQDFVFVLHKHKDCKLPKHITKDSVRFSKGFSAIMRQYWKKRRHWTSSTINAQ